MKLEKLYFVTFMYYTNCMNDTVSDYESNGHDLENTKYLNVGHEPFLIRECDILKYQKFGGGYRDIRFAGNLAVPESFDTLTDCADTGVTNVYDTSDSKSLLETFEDQAVKCGYPEPHFESGSAEISTSQYSSPNRTTIVSM